MEDLQTIELDCPPGNPRPGDLIAGVIKDTGLQLNAPISKFFGNWTWAFSVPRSKWTGEIREIIKPRIEELYYAGIIRYGTW